MVEQGGRRVWRILRINERIFSAVDANGRRRKRNYWPRGWGAAASEERMHDCSAIYEWVGSVVVALLINAMKTLPPKNPPPPPPSTTHIYLFKKKKVHNKFTQLLPVAFLDLFFRVQRTLLKTTSTKERGLKKLRRNQRVRLRKFK